MSRFLAQPGIRRTHAGGPVTLAVTTLLIGVAVGCETSPAPELPPEASAPHWPDESPAAGASDQATGSAAGADGTGHAMAVGPPPVEDIVTLPHTTPPQSLSLKERFETGSRLRREIRIERHYRVRVETGLAATAEGGSELTRAYTVDIDDAVGGQIVVATLTVDEDSRRLLTEDRARVAPGRSTLEGARFRCVLQTDASFVCARPGDESPGPDLTGIVPQRNPMFPDGPASAGESWTIEGRDAEIFLEADGAEATVTFTLDATDAEFRGDHCRHVSYTFAGTQPVHLSGQTHPGELTGSGEFYHCRAASAVVYHRQERDVRLHGPIIRRGTSTPIERTEHIVFEEETTVQPR